MHHRYLLTALVATGSSGCATQSELARFGHPALAAPTLVTSHSPSVGRPLGASLWGATVGGLIGSRFGRQGSSGQTAATAAGAALGAASVYQNTTGLSPAQGAVVGAVIGSRFGRGTGKDLAIVLGAGLGAYLQAPDQSLSTQTQAP